MVAAPVPVPTPAADLARPLADAPLASLPRRNKLVFGLTVLSTIMSAATLVLGGVALSRQRRQKLINVDEDDITAIGAGPTKRRLFVELRRGRSLSFEPELVDLMAQGLHEFGIRPRLATSGRVIEVVAAEPEDEDFDDEDFDENFDDEEEG